METYFYLKDWNTLIKPNRPKKEIVIYKEFSFLPILLLPFLFYLVISKFLEIRSRREPSFGLRSGLLWENVGLIITVLFIVLLIMYFFAVLKNYYEKKPLLRFNYDGFWFYAYDVTNYYFKWKDVQSIKVVKIIRGTGKGRSKTYKVRVYFNSGEYIDIEEYSFPGHCEKLIKIFRKYHTIVDQEESY